GRGLRAEVNRDRRGVRRVVEPVAAALTVDLAGHARAVGEDEPVRVRVALQILNFVEGDVVARAGEAALVLAGDVPQADARGDAIAGERVDGRPAHDRLVRLETP